MKKGRYALMRECWVHLPLRTGWLALHGGGLYFSEGCRNFPVFPISPKKKSRTGLTGARNPPCYNRENGEMGFMKLSCVQLCILPS